MTNQTQHELFAFLVNVVAEGQLQNEETKAIWIQVYDRVLSNIMAEAGVDPDNADMFDALSDQLSKVIAKNAKARAEHLEAQAA